MATTPTSPQNPAVAPLPSPSSAHHVAHPHRPDLGHGQQDIPGTDGTRIHEASTGSEAGQSDVSLSAGMLILYMVIVIAAGVVAGVCLHYIFAVVIPYLHRKWQRYRTRRQLGILLDNDPQNKFPLFQFDPQQVAVHVSDILPSDRQDHGDTDADADAVVIQVDPLAAEPVRVQQVASETDLTANPELALLATLTMASATAPAAESDTTLHHRRRYHSSPFPVPSTSTCSSIDSGSNGQQGLSTSPDAHRRLVVPTPRPPSLLRQHSLSALPPSNPASSTFVITQSPRPSLSRSLSATTATSLFSTLPDQVLPTAAPSSHPAPIAGTSQVTCSICLDDYERGDKVRQLPCGHHFHDRCLRPWLEQSALQAPPAPIAPAAAEDGAPPRRRRNTVTAASAAVPAAAASTQQQPLARSRSLSAFLSAASLGRRRGHGRHTTTDDDMPAHGRWLSLRSRSLTFHTSPNNSLYLSYWQRHPISCPMCRESWSLVPPPPAAAARDEDQEGTTAQGRPGRRRRVTIHVQGYRRTTVVETSEDEEGGEDEEREAGGRRPSHEELGQAEDRGASSSSEDPDEVGSNATSRFDVSVGSSE